MTRGHRRVHLLLWLLVIGAIALTAWRAIGERDQLRAAERLSAASSPIPDAGEAD